MALRSAHQEAWGEVLAGVTVLCSCLFCFVCLFVCLFVCFFWGGGPVLTKTIAAFFHPGSGCRYQYPSEEITFWWIA